MIVTLCLSGPEAEALFCGPIPYASDQPDFQMARRHLSRAYTSHRSKAELERHRAAAHRLVRTPWAEEPAHLIAHALLRHGTLGGEEISRLGRSEAFSPHPPRKSSWT
jgi:hypothetical protein